jgi:glyoxylase-like metal-dependent hydrolase (beta-lactamase superfamily II)
MNRRGLLTLLVAVTLAGCSRATPEQQVVNDAAEALGGADRILAVKTLVLEGTGQQGNLGQDVSPEATGQKFTVSNYRRVLDVAGGRARTELTRTPDFRYFQGQAATKQVNGIDGTVGYNVAANGNANRTNDTVAGDRRLELLHHPVTALRAALDPMAMLANVRTEGAESLVDVTTADGRKFTLAIDSTTKLPARVITAGNNNVLGDVAIITAFADYRDVSGLQLPARVTSLTDDFPTAEYTFATQTVDGETGDLAAPETARTAATPPPPAAPTVAVEPMGRGIWFLAGGTHNSALIEFEDHITLIDTPQTEARGMAVIAKARELVPNKPLTTVINSHHHFDHTGGLRAAMSEGLSILTHQGNVALLEEVAQRPRTIAPDTLSKSPKPAMIQGVGEDMVLSDSTMTVNLYPVSNVHSETMLMAYFPRQRVLFQADLYNEGFAVHPYVNDLLAEIKKRNLQVDRVMTGHGKSVTFAQLVKDASAQPVTTTN